MTHTFPLKRRRKINASASTPSTAAASAASAANSNSKSTKLTLIFLRVADYMTSFKRKSCCGERAGSYIDLTKTKSRTGPRADTFYSLIFNSFNIPCLNEMDFAAFVKLLAKKGHQLDTAKEGIKNDSVSKVVRRNPGTKTDTFF